jgi:N-glycosylase/DNA lyase
LHAFPTLKAFKKKATEPLLRELGFGYRAPYIISSLNTIESKGGEKWLREMRG